MGRKSISRTLLVNIWLLFFAILFTSGCSANTQDSIGSAYSNYGELLKQTGRRIESMAIFLGANTKNIVESSSDEGYIKKLISMEKDFENTVKMMSEIEVPKEVLKYHDVIKQALVEYLEMLKLLLRSSNAPDDNEKKEFLDKAAFKVKKANELARTANENILTIYAILKELNE